MHAPQSTTVSRKTSFWLQSGGVQLIVLALVGTSFAITRQTEFVVQPALPLRPHATAPVEIPRKTPLVITPLYNDPELVSDDDLADVLRKIQPKFAPSSLKPNFIEHALRTWSIHATFRDPAVMSGEAMKDFLTDHGKFLASWNKETPPLLRDEDFGVYVRWGKNDYSSVHHDHWLASLTEAGIPLDEPIFTPNRQHHTVRDALEQALRDFRVDEIETEWSALAFGLWLPPQNKWLLKNGREVSFDLLAKRLLRGHLRFGVCHGTHRLYSLMVLVRLDDEHHILSPEIREQILAHLANVRDLITVSQFDDGHWPSNWSEGKKALTSPADDQLFNKVIATGHHLEWLAIAPPELHPPRAQLRKAARWLIVTTVNQSDADLVGKFTFFSHVGNALALWRQTTPRDFWQNWEAAHPEEGLELPADATSARNTTSR